MPALDETLGDLRQRSAQLFRAAYNGLPVRVQPELAALQVQAIRRRDTGAETAEVNALFSGFDRAHEETALVLARTFSSLVREQAVEDGLAAVLDTASAELETQNSDLVKYALAVFVTNHPVGRNLYIPPLVEQSPEKFIPSDPESSPAGQGLGGLGEEAKLDYFREDPDFNAHHGQWHNVYLAGGLENPNDPDGPRILKDRQGELFWYMHQQMLARYDTERIAVELSPTVAFGDYAAELGEGYAVERIIADRYAGREPDLRISDLVFDLGQGQTLDTSDLDANRLMLRDAAQAGHFEVAGQVVELTPDVAGANLLGSTLEATAATVPLTGDVARVGGLHNIGHGFFSALSGGPGGVMQDTGSAVRDPVFFRWHRHIDDVFYEWQEQLPDNDLAVGAPPVTIRTGPAGQSPDIGLALLRDLAPGTADGTDFDGAAFGATHFGPDNWDTPLADVAGPTGPLTTELESTIGSYPLRLPNGEEFTIFHLDHAEFAYFFRLENQSEDEQRITVRVFLAAAERADDRRWWIEMDKFLQPLAPREKAVIYRPARLSSVVRKTARRPGEPSPGPEDPNDDYCNCGWPYHMLLPRGREGIGGMRFRLLVVLTDGVEDLAGVEQQCGSVSFCGSRDAKYPDNRLMGYPFDRPFTSRTISEAIAEPSLTHLAALDFAIRHEPTA